jgi:hypothetical protein
MRAMLGTVGGRPGLRRLLVSYLLAASLRCQVSSVAGVTGKIPGPVVARNESANYARVESAGDSAGQLLNRVFERHNSSDAVRSQFPR